MSILYSAITFNNDVITNYYTSFESSTSALVESMISISKNINNSTKPNIYNKNKFVCGIIFVCEKFHILCFAPKNFSPNLISSFLIDTSSEILSIAKDKTQTDINMIDSFNNILKEKTEYYNDPKNDKIKIIKSRLEDTKIAILDNIDLAIQRGDKIDELCDQTTHLINNAQNFEQNSKNLKCSMIYKNIKMWILLFFLIVVLVVVILIVVCTPNFSKCKNNQNQK
jgi:vesicle-associated membrane protein 7